MKRRAGSHKNEGADPGQFSAGLSEVNKMNSAAFGAGNNIGDATYHHRLCRPNQFDLVW